MLLLLVHHIAGDGWSLAPLARDLARAYAARRDGRAPDLPALPVQYADYTLWQHEVLGEESDPHSAIARQLAFWTETLKELPDQIDLPSDRPRPAVSSYRGDSVPLALSAELHGGLLALAREGRASLFMVLQAALAALLTRLGAGSDIPIGSPIAGRTDSALDDLIGFFVNTLVLRTDTSGNPSFRELIARVRTTNLAAYSHQDLPFERLVEVLNPARSLSRHPLFQVMLAFQNNAPVSFDGLPSLTASYEPVATTSARFDLSVALGEERASDGSPAGLNGVIEYATDLFDRASMEAMAARLVRLLEAAVAEPDRAIGSLDILGPRRAPHDPARLERHLASDSVRHLAGAVRRAGCPHARRGRGGVRRAEPQLRASSMRAPISWRITCALSACGPRPWWRCASSARPRCSLGSSASSRPAVPICRSIPSYPRERLAFMLEDADAPVLVTHAALLDRLPAHDAARRAPRCRLARHRAAAHGGAGQRASAAQLGLCGLHVGVDRHAEGRRGRSCQLCQQAPDIARALQGRAGLPHRALPVLCVRRFDQAGDAASGRGRRNRRDQRCSSAICIAVLATCRPHRRELHQFRTVLSGIHHSSRSRNRIPETSDPGRRGLHDGIAVSDLATSRDRPGRQSLRTDRDHHRRDQLCGRRRAARRVCPDWTAAAQLPGLRPRRRLAAGAGRRCR